MVSGLRFFRQDPMFPKKNRGRGYYYFRGNLTKGLKSSGQKNPKGFRGAYWSKYGDGHFQMDIDGKKYAKLTNSNNIKNSEENHPHKHDYKTKIRKVRGADGKVIKKKVKTQRIKGRGPKGYF